MDKPERHKVPKNALRIGERKYAELRAGSTPGLREMRMVISYRQLLQGLAYEEAGEEYDWVELRQRWLPVNVNQGYRDDSDKLFDPWRDFDRGRRPNED